MAKQTRKQLGKGLKALLSNMDVEVEKNPEKVVKELSNTVAELPITQIRRFTDQPRRHFEEDALVELSQSIKTYGLIQPITVRRLSQSQYELISGERRFRASQRAGLTMIPAYIRIADDREMLEMALVENIQREDLNPIEIAVTYQRLLDEFQFTHEELSGRVGKNRATVTNYLRLQKLPPEIQNALKNKVISMGHARALISVKDLSIQLAVFNEILTKHLSVRKVEELIRKYRGEAKAKKAPKELPHEYKSVQNNLSNYLDTKVQLKRSEKGDGQIVIRFANDRHLNDLLEKING